ncbi:MAG: hypothetical protein AVDCRST_MAG62-901, partial [uncultured Sphingomonas sp.]
GSSCLRDRHLGLCGRVGRMPTGGYGRDPLREPCRLLGGDRRRAGLKQRLRLSHDRGRVPRRVDDSGRSGEGAARRPGRYLSRRL